MKKIRIKTMIQNYWLLCLAAAIVTLVMNYFCRSNDSDALTWILTPTARWVSVLSGISFEYLPHQGYVNHFYQFLIAPSCAGSRFMLVMFLMLVFSFLISVFLGENENEINMKKEYLWFGFSMVFSYVSTVFVNGIRITASIFLPTVLEGRHLMDGWLTPDRLHTLIGTVSYFTFLCVIYLIAVQIRGRMFGQRGRWTNILIFVPVFWYLLVVLALPFVKRMYHNEWEGFGQYVVVVAGVCCGVYVVFVIGGRIGRWKTIKMRT